MILLLGLYNLRNLNTCPCIEIIRLLFNELFTNNSFDKKMNIRFLDNIYPNI